jgi:hypothetical protein
MKLIRPHSNPPSYKVVDEMARSDERAARADAKVKRFARSQPAPKSYHEVPSPDVEAPPEATSTFTPDIHSALTSVGDHLMQYHHKPASLATVGHALKQVAMKIKPDIGRSAAPKRVTAPEIGERDTSGLFGDEENV